ncbi:MAG: DUF5106 domain-containing protein [Bacteroidales bacterium]|nr:DUF5106 domain-containing protein [Bacteroidales bacterium]
MMLRKIRVVLFFAAVLLTAKGFSQNNYNVDFYIHDLDDTIIYIESYCGSKTEISDSVKVSKDGSFRWRAVDYPMGMYMAKNAKGDMFSFLLDKSKSFSIEIYATGEFFVKNSPENDAYLLYQKENRKCQEAMTFYKIDVKQKPEQVDELRKNVLAIIDSFEVFQKSFYATYPDNLITVVAQGMNQTAPSYFFDGDNVKKGMEQEYMTYYRQHYWDNFRFDDSRILYTPYFIRQYNNYISEITLQDADTVCKAIDEFIAKADSKGGREYADYIIAWYLDNLHRLPFSFNEVIYAHVADKYLKRASAYLYPSVIDFHRQNIEKIKPFLPGKMMPNLVLTDFNGVKHSLYTLKNKYTVVYFFSTSCESCKKNLDDLKNFYKDDKDKYDVEIYSIDIDPDYAMSKARQQAAPFDWIVVHAYAEELEHYNFNLDHTPELYVLDANKRILNKTAIYDHVKQSIENDYNSKNK